MEKTPFNTFFQQLKIFLILENLKNADFARVIQPCTDGDSESTYTYFVELVKIYKMRVFAA